jgi:phage-related protein
LPQSRVVFYQEKHNDVPVLDWLKSLLKQDRKGYANCVARIGQLAELGHELRRPSADYLRDGIYELRAKHRNVQYRILYFYHGQNVAILTHALIKEGSSVPNLDVERAINRKKLFEKNPDKYTYSEETENG